MSAAQNPTDHERSILKKVSLRLLPFLAILYVFCLIDRTNVNIAAKTMQEDLGFNNAVYGLGYGIFFLGYFLFEVPSNLIMERVGARWWIARIMFTWGALSAAMMFVRDPISFYSLRFLLGVAEAGFFPGVVLYITYWIPATSRARAMAVFLAMTAIFQLFSNPLGALLLKMDNTLGLQGWQWLFLLEGIPSMLLAFAVLFGLPDKPAEAKWLTDDERGWLTERLERESVHEHRVQHLTLKTALTEPRILQLCLIFFISATAGNAIGAFGPKMIIAASGNTWSDAYVALLMVFPAIAGAIAILTASFHSDRTGRRTQHVFTGYMIGALGYLGCIFAPLPGLIVLGLSVHALGERIGAGSYWALTTNLLGARAAAGGIAMINSVGNLGGFAGPYAMGHLMDRPGATYSQGLAIAVGLMVIAAVMGALLKRQPVFKATDEPAVV